MNISGVNPLHTYRATVTIVDPDGPGTIVMPNRVIRFHLPGFLLVQMAADGDDEDIDAYPLEQVVKVSSLEPQEGVKVVPTRIR
jgi:hypothetical protein